MVDRLDPTQNLRDPTRFRDSASGLSAVEAQRRLLLRGPLRHPPSSRSYASIIRANVLTVFNLILAGFGTLSLVFEDWRDSLFLGVLISNTAIGIVQEIRAKHVLDRLAALVVPVAMVIRDGTTRRVRLEELVAGDLVRLESGDQVVADGVLVDAVDLAVDESILTGESQSVRRVTGEEVRSGSFAVEGTGRYIVTAVGADMWAQRLVGEARAFRHPRSPLERALDRLLGTLVAIVVPLGIVLGYTLWHRHVPLSEAIPTVVAAGVSLVPEGLILLTSLTFAVAALRMARHGVLTQQLNAIESLASVEVICFDKTGTLTEPNPRVVELIPAPSVDVHQVVQLLGCYAASSPSRNATLAAIAEAYPAEPEKPVAHVAFSSARRWSAVQLGATCYCLGAPELFPLGAFRERAEQAVRQGRRVMAFARTRTSTAPLGQALPPAEEMEVLGLIILSERLRAQAPDTVAYLRSQDLTMKVLSGDATETVAAIAADAGIPFVGPPLDGGALPADPAQFRRLILSTHVIGRLSPEGKRRIIETLREAGYSVAMVGDGINDVPALKAAQLAIAQGSGTQMAKSIADLVLVKSNFAALPTLVAEGRQILRNLQRVTKLFVTKSAFASFLILAFSLIPASYPFLPRHLTLAAALTIGIPSFFLALMPSAGHWRAPSFLRDVGQFAIPAGTAAGCGVLLGYLLSGEVLALSLTEARTVAETVLVLVGLYVILVLHGTGYEERRFVVGLCTSLLAMYVFVLILPVTGDFFALARPNPTILLTAAGGAIVAIGGLRLTGERFMLRGSDVPSERSR